MSSLSASRDAEVVVIGGGLAGCAAAISLAHAGRSVTLYEREAGPKHKVCGEFLSAEALGYLCSLGVEPEALGAMAIHSVRLTSGLTETTAQLPFAAMSVTRKRVDEELLVTAERVGVKVVRGVSVPELEAVHAPNIFIATGKHDLRGSPRPVGKQPGLIAFKMYWRLTEEQARELDGHVDLVTYRGGYGGLQPVEDGVANLCCLIDAKKYARLGGKWELLLAAMRAQSPHLDARLHGAVAMLEKPLAISHIPYGYVRATAMSTQQGSVWALGDQAAVIPSFTGDGMSIALHTGVLAAQMFVEGKSAAEFQRRVFAECSRQIGFATRISQVMVSRWQRPMLLATARAWPGGLRVVAAQTRIAEKHLLV